MKGAIAMNVKVKRLCGFLVLCSCLALLPGQALALIEIGGKEPIHDYGFPDGTLALADLPTRFAYWVGPPFGGGNYHFEYTAQNTDQFNRALETFSIVVAPRHELVVYDAAPKPNFGEEQRVDWEFEVWVTESFNKLFGDPKKNVFEADSEFYNKPLPAPILTLYLGPDNPVVWGKVKIPKNVTVNDKRVAASPYKSSKGGVVRVGVRNMATSAPLAGATLDLTAYTTTTREWKTEYTGQSDRRGTVLIRDIAAGSYQLNLRAPGCAPRAIGYYRNYGKTFETYDASLAPAASLSGTVREGDKPVEGVDVGPMAVLGRDGAGYQIPETRALTDAQGRFTLQGLPAGQVMLGASKTGYHFFSQELHPVPGPDVQIAIERAGVIRGKVTGLEKAAGKPVLVELEQPGGSQVGKWGGSTTCKPDGSFEFNNVPADRYVIFAHPNPSRSQGNIIAPEQPRITFDYAAGEVKELELELK